jgi:hypothetical protein
MKTLLIVAAALGLAGAASAQNTQTAATPEPFDIATLVEVENESMMVAPFGRTVDQIDDADVVGPTGDQIGEIEEVLMTPDGRIAAVSVEFGGFLGFGNKEVVVHIAELQQRGDDFVVGLTEEQLETLPRWDD